MSNQASFVDTTGVGLGGLAVAAIRQLERIPVAMPQMMFRLALAIVFWRSGQTKLAN